MYQQLFSLHAQFLKALSHPRRLEIIHLLRDGSLCVSDIYRMLDLPQANISQHLMILRQAGIVTTRRQGKQVVYKLSHPNIIKASDLVRETLIDQHQHNQTLQSQLHLSMKELVPLVHDPVCHMRLSPRTASFTHTHQDHPYYFCASGCLAAFQKNPTRYLSQNSL